MGSSAQLIYHIADGVDDTFFNMLYFDMCNIREKCTGLGWSYGQNLKKLCIYFEERISPADIR